MHEIFSPSSVVAVVRRRRRPLSPSSVIRHFTLSSKGRTFEKNQIFAVFQNLAIFLKFKILGKMSARDFFTIVRRRSRSSFPSFVVAIVRRRRRPSSVISLFRQRDGPLKKIKFLLFFKNLNFRKIARFLAKWVHEIFSPSSVVAVVRRRHR